MADKQKRTAFFKVMLTPQEKADLQAQAWALDTTPSNLIRALLALPKEIAESVITSKAEASESLDDADNGRVRVLVFDKTTYNRFIFQLRRYGYHYDGCLKALNTINSHSDLPRAEKRALIEEAQDHLRRIDVAKDELIELAYMLLLIPSVQLDEDTRNPRGV